MFQCENIWNVFLINSHFNILFYNVKFCRYRVFNFMKTCWFGGLSTADVFLELVLIMGCYLED